MRRRLLRAVSWAFAMAVSVVAVALLLVASPPGGRWMGSFVAQRVNAQIAGTLALGSVRLEGNQLLVERAELVDPEGRRVARVERAEVGVAPLSLFQNRVHVTRARIVGPTLAWGKEGLARALAPRHPTAPSAATSRGGPAIDLDSVRVEGGTFALEQASGPLELRDLAIDASGRVESGAAEVHARIDARGGATWSGRALPFATAAELDLVDTRATAGLRLEVDGARLSASARGDVQAQRADEVHVLAALPGTEATLGGSGAADALALDAQVDARDLGQTARFLREAAGLQLRLAGEGRATFSVRGSLARPRLSLSSEARTLNFGGTRVRALSLRGSIPNARQPLDASLHASASQLSTGGQSWSSPDVEVACAHRRCSASVRASGALPVELSLRARLDPDLRGLAMTSFALRDATARWALDQGPAQLAFRAGRISVRHLRLRSGKQLVSVDGELRGRRLRASLDVDALDLAALPPELVPKGLGLGGALSLHAHARGDVPRPAADLALELEGGRFHGRAGLGLHVQATYEADRARGRLRATAPGELALEADFDAPVLALRSRRALPLRLHVRLGSVDLASVLHEANVPMHVRGTLSANVVLEGTTRRPDLTARVDVKSLGAGERGPRADVALDLHLDAGSARLTATADEKDRRVAQLDAVVTGVLARLSRPESLLDAPAQLSARIGPLPIEELHRWGAVTEPTGDTAAARGDVVLNVDAKGTPRDPHLTATAHATGLSPANGGSGAVSVSYDYQRSHHRCRLQLNGTNGSELQASASTAFDPLHAGRDLPGATVESEVRSQGLDLAFLSGIIPGVPVVGGQLTTNIHVRGALAHPRYSGALEWKQGALRIASMGSYRDIRLSLKGNDQHLILDDLTARSEKGSLRAKARADQTAPGHRSISATLDLDKFPLAAEDEFVGSLTAHAALQGTMAGGDIEIPKLAIREGRFELPETKQRKVASLRPAKDIVLVRNGTPLHRARPASANGKPALHLRAKIQAPRNLWVHGDDVDVELGLSDDFGVEVSRTVRAYGTVRVLRGRAQVLGRRFDVQRDSKAEFSGPIDEPNVALTAEAKFSQDQVTVTVAVTGRGTDLKIHPSSVPALPETEIYTLLATGHENLRGGATSASPASAAASVVGSFAAGQLQKVLSQKLPLDVLSIQAGDSGQSGVQGTQLEAGKYIGDRLYIGFKARLGANPQLGENANAAHVEYQISHRWRIEAEYGDGRAGYGDLLWDKEY